MESDWPGIEFSRLNRGKRTKNIGKGYVGLIARFLDSRITHWSYDKAKTDDLLSDMSLDESRKAYR